MLSVKYALQFIENFVWTKAKYTTNWDMQIARTIFKHTPEFLLLLSSSPNLPPWILILFQPKNSSPKEAIAYICGLRARIECEPLSEHSTHSDRVTNIGYCLFGGASTLPAANYNSQLFTVLGNGIASLILEIPVRYMTHLSNPSPNPEWCVEPYLRRSK